MIFNFYNEILLVKMDFLSQVIGYRVHIRSVAISCSKMKLERKEIDCIVESTLQIIREVKFKWSVVVTLCTITGNSTSIHAQKFIYCINAVLCKVDVVMQNK